MEKQEREKRAGGTAEGTGCGARLISVGWFADWFLKNFVGEVKIFNGRAALPDKGRPLVLLAAHGPVLGPIPMMAALGRMYLERGLGNEVTGFFHHHSILYIPIVNRIFTRMGALTRLYRLPDLVEALKGGRVRIAGNALEGTSCAFSWDEPVGPFRSGGMIAAALLSGASICLLAHRGTDPWSVRLDLPLGLTVPGSDGLRGLHLQLPPWKKIDRLEVLCRRYRPATTTAKFKKMDRAGRRMAVASEMQSVRARLIGMMRELEKGHFPGDDCVNS
jgi:hypothetical protein